MWTRCHYFHQPCSYIITFQKTKYFPPLCDLLIDHTNEGQCQGKVEGLGHIYPVISLLKVIFESLMARQRLCYGLKEVTAIRTEYLSLSVPHLQSICLLVCLWQLYELMQQNSYTFMCATLSRPHFRVAVVFSSILSSGEHTPLPCSGMFMHSLLLLSSLSLSNRSALFLFHAVTSVLSCLPFHPACSAMPVDTLLKGQFTPKAKIHVFPFTYRAIYPSRQF